LAVTGSFAEDDLGVVCYHSKVGAVELMLNHLVDGGGEYVVVIAPGAILPIRSAWGLSTAPVRWRYRVGFP
jgi:hypothetical protein